MNNINIGDLVECHSSQFYLGYPSGLTVGKIYRCFNRDEREPFFNQILVENDFNQKCWYDIELNFTKASQKDVNTLEPELTILGKFMHSNIDYFKITKECSSV